MNRRPNNPVQRMSAARVREDSDVLGALIADLSRSAYQFVVGMVHPFTSPAISAIAHSASSRIRKIAVSDILAEPTGSSEPPDCVLGFFIRRWPAVAEPARWT